MTRFPRRSALDDPTEILPRQEAPDPDAHPPKGRRFADPAPLEAAPRRAWPEPTDARTELPRRAEPRERPESLREQLDHLEAARADPAPRAEPGRRRWRLRLASVVVALLMLAGAALLLYPPTMAWFSARDAAGRIDRYSTSVSQVTTQERADQLAAADAYNAELLATGAGIADPWGTPTGAAGSGPDAARAADRYDSLLKADNTGMMARLQIPSLKLDLPIYHGDGDDVLRQGVGHVPGSSLPVGGAGTHSVLAAHSGLSTATMFTHLDELKTGDTFTITVMGETLTYRVSDIATVLPDDTDRLRPVAGSDLVTLVTCTPIGINTHRLLVTGTRIDTPQVSADATAAPDTSAMGDLAFPWWAVAGAGALVLATGYVYWSGRPAGSDRAGVSRRPQSHSRRR